MSAIPIHIDTFKHPEAADLVDQLIAIDSEGIPERKEVLDLCRKHGLRLIIAPSLVHEVTLFESTYIVTGDAPLSKNPEIRERFKTSIHVWARMCGVDTTDQAASTDFIERLTACMSEYFKIRRERRENNGSNLEDSGAKTKVFIKHYTEINKMTRETLCNPEANRMWLLQIIDTYNLPASCAPQLEAVAETLINKSFDELTIEATAELLQNSIDLHVEAMNIKSQAAVMHLKNRMVFACWRCINHISPDFKGARNNA